MQVADAARVQTGETPQDHLTRAAAHVRFAPGDERRATQGGAGADGPRDDRDDVALLASEHRGRAQRGAVARSAWQFHGNGDRPRRSTNEEKRRKREWRRRKSNPANAMIWALYHYGISHKSAIRRGRWVARVPYHAWRTAIPRVAWTSGTMAVPRRGVSRALWCRPRVRARSRQLLTLRSRSVGNRGGAGA